MVDSVLIDKKKKKSADGNFITHKLEIIPEKTPSKKLIIAADPDNQLLQENLYFLAGDYAYDKWLKQLLFSHIENNTATVIAPTKLSRDFILHNYFDYLLKAVQKIDHAVVRIDIIVGSSPTIAKSPGIEGYNEKENIIEDLASFINNEEEKNKNKALFFSPIPKENNFENFVCGPSNNLSYLASRQLAIDLVAKYSTKSVKSATKGSFSLHNSKGLCIYGKSGLGKSHLLHGIANYVKEHAPSAKIGYFSAEKFTQNYVAAVKSNQLLEYKNAISSLDIVIIDDIQFICSRAGTKKEFAKNIDILLDSGKCLIMATSSNPHSLDLDERCKSRIVSLMLTRIENPEYELRYNIICSKLSSMSSTMLMAEKIGDEMVSYIASSARVDNVRELQGILYKFVTCCELTKTPPSLSLLSQIICEDNRVLNENDNTNLRKKGLIIKNSVLSGPAKLNREKRKFISPELTESSSKLQRAVICHNDNGEVRSKDKLHKSSSAPDHNQILHLIAKSFSVSKKEICSRQRSARLLLPRKVAAYIMRQFAYPLKEIGYHLDGRDHSTIAHMVKSCQILVNEDENLCSLVRSIWQNLSEV